MNYMGEMAKQTSSRFDNKVAESSEFKHFLFYLAERAPLVMHGLLKLVSNKCEITLRVESKARLARKRAELHSGDGTNAKRLKLTRPNEQDTVSSRRVAKPDVSVQVRDRMRRSSRDLDADSLGPRDLLVLFPSNRRANKSLLTGLT